MAPMPNPVVVPDTAARRFVRDPVMTMDGSGARDGVTAFDGLEGSDQPAPVSAFTANVYDVPFVSPVTVQLRDEVRQVRAPGEDVAR